MAARLLRLYISTAAPSEQLNLLVLYLMGHYVPLWFQLRTCSSCTDGPPNLLRSVQLLQALPSQLRKVIEPVIQRNAYWAHPEALLLAMAADRHRQVRTQAVRTIQRCRQQPPTGQVRPYILPRVRFSATTLPELINWEKELITEPPLTISLSAEDIDNIRTAPLQVACYPIHTVAVERTVRVVTEAASAVVGEEQRHGFVCNRLRHRQQLPVITGKRCWLTANPTRP